MNIDTKHHLQKVVADLKKHVNNLETELQFASLTNSERHDIENAVVEAKSVIEWLEMAIRQ